MKQIIIYDESSEVISAAVDKVNRLLQNDDFHEKLSAKDSFDEANVTGTVISNLIKTTNLKIKIEIYKSNWPWSKSNGYTTPTHLSTIFLNKRKISEMDENDWAATIVHEFIHLLDFENTTLFFAHGSNSRIDKDNTAPYWIDNLAYTLLTQTQN